MSPWGIGVGDIIKEFNEKLAKERKEVKRLREGIKELAESWTDRKVGRPSDLLVLAANELKRLIE